VRGVGDELALGAILVDRPEFSWRLNVAADRTRQNVQVRTIWPLP